MERKRRQQRGFTLMELLIVIAIILVILTMAIPQYNKQVMFSHETAAIRAMGTLHVAETQYMSQFGTFATTLAQLGPPASGTATQNAAELISKDLAEGKVSGYTFTLTATPTGYAVNATPDTFNGTGRFTYYSDQTMVIRRNTTAEPATASSPQIK
jgi:type IV pilus assembly protein PilA